MPCMSFFLGSPCVLYCRQDVKGIHYSVRFAATVTDGTQCRQGVNGICVDGKCEVCAWGFMRLGSSVPSYYDKNGNCEIYVYLL